MATTSRTISEALFESFCTENDIHFCPIPTESQRTPDYVFRLGDTSIAVEVKQFDPSPTELVTLRKKPEQWGESDAFCPGIPGERVRSKIDSALPQLKRIARDSMPAILVLYDNIRLWPEICDARAIAAAMYGIETALISAEQAQEGGAKIIARWHGASRRATPTANTTLSAIGVLDAISGTTSLTLFHNFFARNPIPTDVVQKAAVKHCFLKRSPERYLSEWVTASDNAG
jgi:hypothetical protein